MSDYAQALATLAAKCGIEAGFHEVSGRYRETSGDTMRLLLASMGVPAHNAVETAASLDQVEREEWQPGLPPVAVAYAGSPIVIELVLPHNVGELTWHLALENGVGRYAKFSFARRPAFLSCSAV